jgi:hypothetical protein
MRYEIPELMTLTTAINVIQGGSTKLKGPILETSISNEIVSAYEDWE